jgi:hypothetical protein
MKQASYNIADKSEDLDLERDMQEEMRHDMQKRRYKKITHADLIGKTAGRWTRQEHLRFI